MSARIVQFLQPQATARLLTNLILVIVEKLVLATPVLALHTSWSESRSCLDSSHEIPSAVTIASKDLKHLTSFHCSAFIWGAVARWLERAIDNLVVAGLNPAEAVWKLWQFPLPHFASVFRKRHYKPVVPSIRCLCQGKLKYPIQGVNVQPVVDSIIILPGQ